MAQWRVITGSRELCNDADPDIGAESGEHQPRPIGWNEAAILAIGSERGLTDSGLITDTEILAGQHGLSSDDPDVSAAGALDWARAQGYAAFEDGQWVLTEEGNAVLTEIIGQDLTGVEEQPTD